MKTGLIVYVVGTEPADWNAASEMKTIRQICQADLVEIITAQWGHFDVLDAWWSLLTRGMKQVICMIGEFAPNGRLTLQERKLCLCE
ncbi:MAG: hypothetical protein LJE66_12935 [Desulfobacterales bacterium]|jgi:hypothetical protein|nr:hypothetical protein [Desulfobacterales bacterium]